MSINVMVNGIPGKMGISVAESIIGRNWNLVPFSLSGNSKNGQFVEIEGRKIELLGSSVREERINDIIKKYPELIVVDYTLPAAVNSNSEFYIKHNLPFVMGTTGGDRELMLKSLAQTNLPCVIAPNMGKQIVAFQAMMEYMAKEYPGVFEGYSLKVEESHQKSKVDTSGTAKAVVSSFNKMGLQQSVSDIIKYRTDAESMDLLGVPEVALDGHAFHTYSLVSKDETVAFQFKHNVSGRRFYAEGTADAVGFLAAKAKSGESKIFDMVDVLRSRSMEF